MSDKLVADLARDFVRVLNVSGQRHASREALIFCEGVEQADAPLVVAVDVPLTVAAPALADVIAPVVVLPGEHMAPDKVEE